MVRTQARYVSLIRALLRREGLRVRTGSTGCFLERLADVDLPVHLRLEIEPLVSVRDSLGEQIARADAQMAELAVQDSEVRRLCTTPGVGQGDASLGR